MYLVFTFKKCNEAYLLSFEMPVFAFSRFSLCAWIDSDSTASLSSSAPVSGSGPG